MTMQCSCFVIDALIFQPYNDRHGEARIVRRFCWVLDQYDKTETISEI
jgi:hypothetical protein